MGGVKGDAAATEMWGDDRKMYVALLNTARFGKDNMWWVLDRTPPDRTIVFLYVEAQRGLYLTSQPKPRDKKDMNIILGEYMDLCKKKKIKTESLVIKMDDIATGLVTLIDQNMITKLVMDAAEDWFYESCARQLNSPVAISVNEQADPSCKIWFICHGNEIYVREPTSARLNKVQSSNNSSSKDEVIIKNVTPAEVKQSTGRLESTRINQTDQGQSTSTALEEHDEESKNQQASREQPSSLKQENDQEKWDDLTTFSFEELKEATSNFSDSNRLGQGGFGSVYKGELLYTEVAIKMLNTEGDAHQEKAFRQEVDILRRVSHPHLVRLMGVCPEKCALVYQFMHGGTLEDRLSRKDLPWQDRIRIATETCSALLFLHSRKPDIVVHGDLKPANVLLDSKGMSVLGDFGICRIISPSNTTTAYITVTSIQGSNGYIDPAFTSKLQPSIDVYAFGMLLLVLLTNKHAGVNLFYEVEDAITTNLECLIDDTAKWPPQTAEEVAKIALSCSNLNQRKRPQLSKVYVELNQIKKKALSA